MFLALVWVGGRYFEYSSTMSCSRTGTSMWARWGRSRTVTLLPPSLTSSQPTTEPVEHVEVVADDDHLHRLLAEGDHLAGPHAVAGDVDPLAVDVDEAVVDELAGLGPGGRPAGAVDHVVEAQLEQAEQVLAGDAREAGGLLVGPAELALQDAVDVLGLLLLLELDQVLAPAAAPAGAAVRAGRVGAALQRLAPLVVLEDVGAEAARELDLRPGVARHVRPSAALAGGIRCAAPG